MRILMLPGGAGLENPYVASLETGLGNVGADVSPFRLRRLAFGTVDVLHIHWPEWVRWLHLGPLTLLRVVTLTLALRICAHRGIRVVWTVHNVRPHEPGRLVDLAYRRVVAHADGIIVMSRASLDEVWAAYPSLRGRAHAVVPHGHYRDSYELVERSAARHELGIPESSAVVGAFGRIRRYKGLPDLCRVVQASARDDLRLLIAGRADDADSITQAQGLAAGDRRIMIEPRHLTERELATRVAACDLIALPFENVLNSGSAILALSLNRPVLVPARGSLVELAEIVGPDWVRTYSGALTTDALEQALDWSRDRAPNAVAGLDALDWSRVARDTLGLYEAVVAGRGAVRP